MGDFGSMMNNPELAEMMRDPESFQNMMQKSMQAMMGGDMAEKLPELMKGLEAINPELTELLSDPSKMQVHIHRSGPMYW